MAGADMKRILILEDDEDLAEGIEMSLRDDDVEPVRCRLVAEAERLVREKDFDLLILDINLPDGSGLELCRKVRTFSRVPVALLTVKDMETDIVRGLECGADDYITKPFSLMVLRARVRALLRRTAGEKQAEYRDDVFRFSFDRMEFYKRGSAVELSKTEQKLLRIFIENRGITLSRGSLVDRVWTDGAEYVDENALSVTVKRLRDKLGAKDDIKTVYGKGYMWVKEDE